jgi:calcineurin-like phosphoesterase family protein
MRRLIDHVFPMIVAGLVAASCSSPDETGPAPISRVDPPKPLPALTSAPLTTEMTLIPTHAIIEATLERDPAVPAAMDSLLSEGFGDLKPGPAWPMEASTLDGAPPPAPGSAPKRLTRFVHLADTQLADDESPARLALFDSPGISGAFRPQEGHECRILNAAVRTINVLHQKTPVDFVVLGGDNADNAQQNELGWFLSILGGAPSVECDSGKDDDPVSGPDNDPKDPFVAEGLKVPWLWVTGNHDILNQGNFPPADHAEDAIGAYSFSGARDWSQPGAPVIKEDIPADPRREVLTRKSMLEMVAKNGDGHGINAGVETLGKAFYTFDVKGTPIRIVVLDTAAESGGPNGVIHQADIDAFVKPALDQAKAEKKWVILTSHHASRLIGDGSMLGFPKQADALTVEAWQSFIGGYDNVLLHLAGHTHLHRVTKTAPVGGHAYWELETSALADFPHQMRVIEVWDEDNGYLTIRGTALDYQIEGDPIAADGRSRSVVDFTSGWVGDGSGTLDGRNVALWIKKPQ